MPALVTLQARKWATNYSYDFLILDGQLARMLKLVFMRLKKWAGKASKHVTGVPTPLTKKGNWEMRRKEAWALEKKKSRPVAQLLSKDLASSFLLWRRAARRRLVSYYTHTLLILCRIAFHFSPLLMSLSCKAPFPYNNTNNLIANASFMSFPCICHYLTSCPYIF